MKILTYHREMEDTYMLLKIPRKIQIQGILRRKSFLQLYSEMQNKLEKLRKKGARMEEEAIMEIQIRYLEKKHEKLSEDHYQDMNVLSIIRGYDVITESYGTDRVKEMVFDKLNKLYDGTNDKQYKLRHPEIIKSMICGYLALCQVFRHKLGEANKYLQTANESISNLNPCIWTARVQEANALYELICGVVGLKDPDTCYSHASERFIRAKAECVDGIDDQDLLLYMKVYYDLQVIFLKLKMPVALLMYLCSSSEVVKQNIETCTVTETEIDEIENKIDRIKIDSVLLLNSVVPESKCYKVGIEKYITFADILHGYWKANIYAKGKRYEEAIPVVNGTLFRLQKWIQNSGSHLLFRNLVECVKTRLLPEVEKLQNRVIICLPNVSSSGTNESPLMPSSSDPNDIGSDVV